jgi:hypothetical protein
MQTMLAAAYLESSSLSLSRGSMQVLRYTKIMSMVRRTRTLSLSKWSTLCHVHSNECLILYHHQKMQCRILFYLLDCIRSTMIFTRSILTYRNIYIYLWRNSSLIGMVQMPKSANWAVYSLPQFLVCCCLHHYILKISNPILNIVLYRYLYFKKCN